MKVIAIPDIHNPYCDLDSLKKALRIVKKENPDVVVQLGDIYDFYCLSKFSRSYNISTPQDELQTAHSMAKTFWKRVKQAAPKAKCYQLIGNHSDRLKKRIADKLPEIESLLESHQLLFDFDGVKVLETSRDHLEIEGVIYIHGWMSRMTHYKYFNKPVVHAHTHRAGIVYERTKDSVLWELDTGCLVDETLVPFSYTASKTSKWIKAIGIIENGIPRLELL